MRTVPGRRALRCKAAACLAIALLAGGPVAAQDAPTQKPADSIWNWPALLDPPTGPRRTLRDHGLTVDAWVTQFYQGALSSDGNKTWQYGGKGDLILTLDGAKAGLWPGFFVSLHQEWNFGRDANFLKDGTLLPINTAMAFPRLGGFDENTSLVVTQNFGESLSISAGKFNLLDIAAKTPIAGGGGLDTFMHMAFAAPISGVTPPYLLGAIGTLKTEPAIFTLMVYDPRNAQAREVLEKPFSEGVTTSLSVTVPTKIAGLPGYYGVRGVYSSHAGFNLNDVPALLLPPGSDVFLQKKGYYYVSASAQQYLYQDPANPRLGWGLFAEAGVSEGNPNPIKWHLTAGIGGSGFVNGRELDRWGIGYFRYSLSKDLTDGLRLAGLQLRDEQGVEAYYALAMTPWLRVTANLQWISPYRPGFKDATYAGLRTQVRF